MAWNNLKAAVAAVIKTNGNQEITGALLQASLNSIIDQVGGNATYKGIAIPSTAPGVPDGPVFYLASKPGYYANFGGTLINGGLYLFSYNGGSWTYTNLFGFNDFIVDCSVENWTGGSSILYIDYIYRNDLTYGSGVRVQKANPDLSSPTSVAYWANLSGVKSGVERLTKIAMLSSLGYITLTVNWDKVPNPSNPGAIYTIIIPSKSYIPDIRVKDLTDPVNAILLASQNYVEKDPNTLLLTNTRISDITYIHPSGESEYEGNANYNQPGIGICLPPQSKKLLVRRIKAKIYASSGSANVTVSVYKGTTKSATLGSHTLVEQIIFPAGSFNTISSNYQTVVLSNDLILAANEYLYLIAETVTGYIYLRYWTTQTTPARDSFLLKVSGVWYFSSTNYYTTPLKLYSSVSDSIDYGPEISELDERVTLLEAQGSTSIDISLPDKIYATVGDRLQLFYRGMIKAPNPYIYDILVSCSKGIQYPRYFEYLPVSGDVGTTTFKVEVKNKDGVVLGTKTCSLITKAVVQSPSATKKVLCVGDSLTSAGLWCIEASRRLVGSGGTPAGLALSNIAFTGRKTGSGIGWEGTGGWTWASYATAGTPAYKFFLSGVTTAPGIGSTYTNNGITYTVSEVNITGGTGYISATGSGAPTSSGTLTKASGTGDATLAFSSYSADSGNPFWEADTNSLDFPQYVNTYMGGACDVIYFLLTWNGQTPWRTDFASMITTAKTLIDHIHTHYPNCKIKIMGVQVPSLNGGMGANYGATGTSYADTYGNVVTVLNMNKAYQDWCNEAAYSSFLEFVNVSAQFDSENNMPETDKAVNTRSTKTEKIGTNGVHPSTEGYYQIGDVVFRNFIANFCQ